MRLMRIGAPSAERPVVRLDERSCLDVSDHVADFDEEFFGRDGMAQLRDLVDRHARDGSGTVRPLGGERVGAPIARPHQIWCIGLNYRDHAAESGQPVPAEPVVFTKAPNTIVGPDDDVRLPRGSSKTDWEVELGVVVGRRCRYLDGLDEARAAIAGFVLVNDVSERAFQLERGGQWVKGKSAETFGPMGPWLVTPDEIPEVGNLAMSLDVNGVRKQTGSTKTMIFSIPFLLAYITQFMVLDPGDVVTTGTPPGVGSARNPREYLKAGDVMTLAIDGLGTQRQTVVPFKM